MPTSLKTGARFKRRVCRHCGNNLIRVSPARQPFDELSWGVPKPEGIFYCEKCDSQSRFPLVGDEPRDIELAPKVRA
jgi:RNase P subunit RPR2